eukprot:scaffold859_cov191-Chaetoceros_neogracile.AAC.1
MSGDVIETSLSGYAVKRFPDRIEMFDVYVVEERTSHLKTYVVGTHFKWAGSCRQKKRIKDKDALSHAGAAIPILEFVSKVLVRSFRRWKAQLSLQYDLSILSSLHRSLKALSLHADWVFYYYCQSFHHVALIIDALSKHLLDILIFDWRLAAHRSDAIITMM